MAFLLVKFCFSVLYLFWDLPVLSGSSSQRLEKYLSAFSVWNEADFRQYPQSQNGCRLPLHKRSSPFSYPDELSPYQWLCGCLISQLRENSLRFVRAYKVIRKHMLYILYAFPDDRFIKRTTILTWQKHKQTGAFTLCKLLRLSFLLRYLAKEIKLIHRKSDVNLK